MFELTLKLVGLPVILIVALIQLGLENRWRDQRTRQRWTRFLVAVMIVSTMLTGFDFWYTHNAEQKERERIAKTTNERQIKAREERQEISVSIKELVELAREHDASLTEQEALTEISTEVRSLRKQTALLGSELQGLKKYGNVAKLHAKGLTGMAGAGLRESSALSRALEGAYVEKEGRLYPRCDTEGMTRFANVAKKYPAFPFAHYALAVCQQIAGNPQWRVHANRALEIVIHTTQVAGHHRDHDAIHQELTQLLTQ